MGLAELQVGGMQNDQPGVCKQLQDHGKRQATAARLEVGVGGTMLSQCLPATGKGPATQPGWSQVWGGSECGCILQSPGRTCDWLRFRRCS